MLSLLSACGSSTEVTEVRTPARTADRSQEATPDTGEAAGPFRLHVGELEQAYSIDPLFAVYPASQRMVSLIYEGLTRLDENGNVQPALAASWEISEDSTRYTFTLRDTAFFHDDPAFSTGQGRRVRAQDVRFTFTRMTERQVPEQAAELFNPHIKGFEAFFTQRRHAYFERERLMDYIPGITALDEDTIEFELNAPAPDFLKLLAMPQASVYPEEAFERRGTRREARAIGSGPFVFSQAQGDSLLILERNFDFYDETRTAEGLNSISFQFFGDEASLFSAFSAGSIQLIPQAGPLTAQTTLRAEENTEIELAPAYSGQLRLETHHANHVGVYFKEDNSFNMPETALGPIQELLQGEDFRSHLPPFSEVALMAHEGAEQEDGHAVTSGNFDIGTHPGAHATFIAARMATDLNEAHEEQDRDISVYPLPRVHRDVALYVTPESAVDASPARAAGLTQIARLSLPQFSLQHDDEGGIVFNGHYWWMSLENARPPREARESALLEGDAETAR